MKRQSDKITAVYCRLAHYDGELDTLAGQHQQDALLEYAAAHDLEHPQLFCDWGFSGTDSRRPEYQRMLREVKAGNVSSIVVKDLSRLSRDHAACFELVGCTLPKFGVELHSVKDCPGNSEVFAGHGQLIQFFQSLYRQSQRGGRK